MDFFGFSLLGFKRGRTMTFLSTWPCSWDSVEPFEYLYGRVNTLTRITEFSYNATVNIKKEGIFLRRNGFFWLQYFGIQTGTHNDISKHMKVFTGYRGAIWVLVYACKYIDTYNGIQSYHHCGYKEGGDIFAKEWIFLASVFWDSKGDAQWHF